MQLDNKDMQIISLLKKDARAPIKEISKSLKMRPSTVHGRIQKLIASKVIEKFTVKLNNREIGENFIVFMLVKGSTSDYIDKKMLEGRHVKEVFGVTGEYDLLLKLKFEDVEEFHQFLLDFRKSKKEVNSTLTMVATANLKEEL